jgi:hypothetical protein
VIFTALFIPILGGAYINKGLESDFQEEMDRYQGGTTLALLTDAMTLKNAKQRALFLEEQQALMPYNLKLKALDTLDLPNHKMLQLYQNKLVYNSDNQFLYMILAGHEQVLILENVNIRSDHIYSDAEREGMGLMALLQRQLKRTESHEWDALIARKATLFSFDIELKPLGVFPLNQRQQLKLDKGKLVAISQDSLVRYGSGLNYLLQLTPNGKHVLIAGPIAPAITSLINEYFLVNTAFLAMMLLCLLSFWIWPTWRSSRELLAFIHQHAEQGNATKLILRFGSHFNELHNAFNQMSANIARQFSLNKMVTQYLSRRLDAPLKEMKQGLDKIEASDDTRITNNEIAKQEKAINTIRHLSSDILLFSQVQGINTLVNRVSFDLENWLFTQQDKLFEASSRLNIVRVNQRREVYLESKLMTQGLIQILNVIKGEKLNTLRMSVAVNQACATLNIYCDSADEGLEKDLKLLCDMSHNPVSKSVLMITSALYLPLFCCARIVSLHGGRLQLQKNQNGTLILDIMFCDSNQLPMEVEA